MRLGSVVADPNPLFNSPRLAVQKVYCSMKRKPLRKAKSEDLSSLCGRLGPDDGINPRELFKTSRRSKNDRKDRQLCRQVFETLSYVLSSVGHDEQLQDLVVREVIPAPDATRLLVVVCPFAATDQVNPAEVLQQLYQASGRLRAEIARSISRRAVPDLMFRVDIDGSPQQREERGGTHE